MSWKKLQWFLFCHVFSQHRDRDGQPRPLAADSAPLSGSDSESELVNEPTHASDDSAHEDRLKAMAQEEAEEWDEDSEQEWEEESGSDTDSGSDSGSE